MRRLFYLTLTALVVIGLVGELTLAKSYKSSKSAWLGIYSQTVDEDLAEAFDLPIEYGVVVNEVVDDSPAEEAGLEEDDIIIAINGSKIIDLDELVEMIEDSRPGDEVVLLVMRDGEKQELTVTLQKRPSDKRVWVAKTPKDKGKSYFYSFDYDGKRSYIGVSLMDLSKQLGDFFGVEKGKGALITEVHEDSPAEKADLKAGDVIVAIDDEKVIDAEDVQELVEDYEPGEEIGITIIRSKKKSTIPVEVGETEDASFGYFYGHPYAPDISITVPKIKKLIHKPLPKSDEEFELDFEFDDFQGEFKGFKKEMKEFEKELKTLKKELQELREKLK